MRHLWCDKWHAEVQRLKDTLDVPLLDLDVDGGPVALRHRTRVQAFLEGLYNGSSTMRQAYDASGPHFGTGTACPRSTVQESP